MGNVRRFGCKSSQRGEISSSMAGPKVAAAQGGFARSCRQNVELYASFNYAYQYMLANAVSCHLFQLVNCSLLLG